MTAHHSSDYLTALVRELCNLPGETEWVEFKENNADPETIGKNISALANSAALEGKAFAYIVWGKTKTMRWLGLPSSSWQ